MNVDISSNKISLLVASALGLGLVAAPLLGQSGQAGREQQDQEKRAPERHEVKLVEHDTILGASVTNGRESEDAQALGTISDLLIEPRNGRMRIAVLDRERTAGAGVRRTAVPWSAFAWDAKANKLTLSMTASEIDDLPEFDPGRLQRIGARPVEGVEGDDNVGGAAGSQTQPSLLLASQIHDWSVLAGEERLGSADALLIEPKSGSVAFLNVGTGGLLGIGESEYVVPWAAFRVDIPIDKPELKVLVNQAAVESKGALKPAPKLGEEGADVNRPEFRNQIYEFYGVERPAFEPKEKGTERTGAAESGRRSIGSRR